MFTSRPCKSMLFHSPPPCEKEVGVVSEQSNCEDNMHHMTTYRALCTSYGQSKLAAYVFLERSLTSEQSADAWPGEVESRGWGDSDHRKSEHSRSAPRATPQTTNGCDKPLRMWLCFIALAVFDEHKQHGASNASAASWCVDGADRR